MRRSGVDGCRAQLAADFGGQLSLQRGAALCGPEGGLSPNRRDVDQVRAGRLPGVPPLARGDVRLQHGQRPRAASELPHQQLDGQRGGQDAHLRGGLEAHRHSARGTQI
eukprot:scaffold1620_cov233-Pinguiococcus_pyrenoidosus.AAC.11